MHVQDHGLYRAMCPAGHQLVVMLDNLPFQLLFESGLEALVDGYFRESVSSFAAALERLYEFSIRIQLRSEGVDPKAFERMWKLVSVQSERQLGMYIGVRTLKEGKEPPTLSQSQIKFRNLVIHKGYFPSGEESFEFGCSVFRLIMDEVMRLDAVYKSAVADETLYHRVRNSDLLNEGENPVFLFLGMAVADRSHRTFADVVARAQASMQRRRVS
ncbi:hypothetical protein [Pseudomonas tohonis]|nr:hypothetical protein [Pseudomonas tohonis]